MSMSDHMVIFSVPSRALSWIMSSPELKPPTQLSAQSRKPRVVVIRKLGHIHMVAVDSNRDVTRQDGRVLRYDLFV